jgi:hypothetical protein
MSTLRKPYYHVDEALMRWDITERDIIAFVLADELTVSATVARLRVRYGSIEKVADGEFVRIPEGQRHLIGTVDLHRDDAWHILRKGSQSVRSLKAPPGTFQEIDDDEHVIHRDDLVICRAEMERFEKELGLAPAPEKQGRRGAPPRFDWDSFWIEVCRIVHEDGIPLTQSELVRRMNEWFDSRNRASPDESTVKKKLKPLWHTLRPDEPGRALSHAR